MPPNDYSVDYHKTNNLNRRISIQPVGVPGPGGAHCLYQIQLDGMILALPFQNGDPSQKITGFTNEAILAILQHRFEGFSNGKFQCAENDCALFHIRQAMNALDQRTQRRVKSGTEGTQEGK